jgi:peptide methionine sulfoxide reductase MsrA
MSLVSFEKAVFAGGCFWCIEAAVDNQPGIIQTLSGYTGGTSPSPTYDDLMTHFWKHINPTSIYSKKQTKRKRVSPIYIFI